MMMRCLHQQQTEGGCYYNGPLYLKNHEGSLSISTISLRQRFVLNLNMPLPVKDFICEDPDISEEDSAAFYKTKKSKAIKNKIVALAEKLKATYLYVELCDFEMPWTYSVILNGEFGGTAYDEAFVAVTWNRTANDIEIQFLPNVKTKSEVCVVTFCSSQGKENLLTFHRSLRATGKRASSGIGGANASKRRNVSPPSEICSGLFSDDSSNVNNSSSNK
jgi:hypothetical protein